MFNQVENEYGLIEPDWGPPGAAYAKWAGEMALTLGAGVPWVMCLQEDAPGEVVCSKSPLESFACINVMSQRFLITTMGSLLVSTLSKVSQWFGFICAGNV